MRTRSQAPSAHEESAETTQTNARKYGNSKESRRRKSRELGVIGGDRSSRDTSEEEALMVEDGRTRKDWDGGASANKTWDVAHKERNKSTPPPVAATYPICITHTKHTRPRPKRRRSPWATSVLILFVTAFAAFFSFSIVQAFLSRQKDPDGCKMSYMNAGFVAFPEFDTEYTRFARKYSLYLYREMGVDEDARVRLY